MLSSSRVRIAFGQWYYNKRIIICLVVAVILAATFWFFYQNEPLFRKISPQPPHNNNYRQYPFMAFLNVENINETQNCGGTLINERFILTAAHCVEKALETNIILGTDNILKGDASKLLLESENYIIHESYNNNTFDNDIALIYINKSVAMNENIKTVSLFLTLPKGNTKCVVLGWGNDQNEGVQPQLGIKNVTFSKIPFCNLNGTEKTMDYSKFCTWGVNGPCHGDSGGPLLYMNSQIGIVSGGDKSCDSSTPKVHTNIMYYLDWIEQKVFEYKTMEEQQNEITFEYAEEE